MTPKKRKLKTTVSLARSLKPSGRLNVDDVKKAKDLRKTMSLSQIKDAKKLGKAAQLAKGATKAASTMGVAGSLKKLLDKKKTPMKKALGPLRPIRERARQSRLVGGKSKFTKPKR